ncbi:MULTISPECIES: hypothetical protein [Akkermansia]|jgi:hypothetical protein|uniref:hypothetical protein n=1 Tax=Akkermansia TaxID=239934 RepID=UPI0020301EB8|nr:hypothetical protein [Akkermansia sp. B2-R-115]MCM0686488.1 hypothetical protein [Akkermansia sp. B2-R-115]
MKNILWIFLFSILMLPESPAALASSGSDIQTLLSEGRSSFIAGKAREALRNRLDSGPLTIEKIRELIHSPQVASLCYLHQFFNTAEDGKPFTQEELKDQIFREWLSSHPGVFKMLAQSGPASKNTLSVFYQIWNTSDQKLNPVELSMALGAALIANTFSPEECIAKFNFYRDSHHHARCYPQAGTLQPWEWAIVFRGKESLEDLAWAQQFIEGKKIKPEKAGSRFTGFIPYRKKNDKGVSVHAGAAFYDRKPITLKLYTEYGGVCGAVSKGAAGFLRSKGVPAYPIGQPGHCAFVWKHPNGHWQIGNNIGGWNWANGGAQIPWKGPIQLVSAYDSFIHHPNAEESALTYYLSFCTQKPEHADLLLREARQFNPFNYPAWLRYLDTKAKNGNDQRKLALLKELAQAVPNEHNLIWHVAKNVLNIRENRVNPYELYACVLGPDCTSHAEELFTRLVWTRLVTDCPEIKSITEYKTGFTGKHLFIWVRKGKFASWTPKMKKYSVRVLQSSIVALEGKDKTQKHYIETYQNLLDIWNDEKLNQEGKDFIEKFPVLRKRTQNRLQHHEKKLK